MLYAHFGSAPASPRLPLTLALGIGATSAVFGLVQQVLLTPLPYGHPEGVVVVWSAWKGFDQTWLSYDEWEGWKARVGAFADIGLYTDGSATIDGSSPERVRAANVQRSVLPILGVRPERGRDFTADEDRPGGPRVAILSHELWQRGFGADPSVVGREDPDLRERAVTVVGVMPAGFRLPIDYAAGQRTDVWLPLATDAASEGAVPGPAFPKGGASHGFYAVARLAPGATASMANAQLRTLVAELERYGYMANVGFHAFVVPVEQQITGRVRPVLLVRLRRCGARAADRLRERRRVAARARRGSAPRARRSRGVGRGRSPACAIADHGERRARAVGGAAGVALAALRFTRCGRTRRRDCRGSPIRRSTGAFLLRAGDHRRNGIAHRRASARRTPRALRRRASCEKAGAVPRAGGRGCAGGNRWSRRRSHWPSCSLPARG